MAEHDSGHQSELAPQQLVAAQMVQDPERTVLTGRDREPPSVRKPDPSTKPRAIHSLRTLDHSRVTDS